ncbi:MAG: GumC family protein [Sandaracinaceae bacterium]
MARQEADDGLETEGQKSGRPGFPVDPYRVLRAVLRGKWWLFSAAAIGALAGYLIGKFVVKREYESVATIQYVGRPGDNPAEIQRAMPSLSALARSAPVRRETRDRIGLPPEVSVEAMDFVVMITADDGAGIISFHGFAPDGELAAQYANTGVDVYLQSYSGQRRHEVESQIASIDERMTAARSELATARQTYDRFRASNGISDLSAEQEQAIDQAADLRAQADLARAEIETLEARIRTLRNQIGRTDRTVSVSGGTSADQQRLTQLQQLLREARASGLGEEHPRVRALAAQVEAAQRAAGGGGTTRSSSNPIFESLEARLSESETELEAARQRQVSLEQLADQAQERTSRFSAIEGQAATLLAAVNVKQALVTQLTEQRSVLDDQLTDAATGFRSVAEARAPESAIPSKRKYVVAAGIPLIFVSIMLAMLLYRELRGFKVVTAREVAFWGNGPVIGVTVWPRVERALMDLIAGMDDYAPNATGTMLVVGATEAEREHAIEIAGQLNHDWSSQTLIDVPVLGALPPGDDSDPPPPSDGYLEDEPVVGEIYDGPTEIGVSSRTELALMGGPTEIEITRESDDPPPASARLANPAERLVCTPWNDRPEGQALRRAARLADRVLVVVTSNGIRADELAQLKRRLGRDEAIAYVVIGVSDDVSRLDDRAGKVDAFWNLAPT